MYDTRTRITHTHPNTHGVKVHTLYANRTQTALAKAGCRNTIGIYRHIFEGVYIGVRDE